METYPLSYKIEDIAPSFLRNYLCNNKTEKSVFSQEANYILCRDSKSIRSFIEECISRPFNISRFEEAIEDKVL